MFLVNSILFYFFLSLWSFSLNKGPSKAVHVVDIINNTVANEIQVLKLKHDQHVAWFYMAILFPAFAESGTQFKLKLELLEIWTCRGGKWSWGATSVWCTLN